MLKNILGGVGWVSTYSIAQLVANLLLTMALARLLAPAEIGSYAYALVIVTFLQIFAQLGINAAMIQIEDADEEFFATAFSIVLAASLIVTLVSVLGITAWLAVYPAPGTSNGEMLSALRILALSLPFFAVADLFQARFNRELAFRVPASTSFASYLLGYAVVALVLAKLGFGAYALIFAFLTQHVLRVALLMLRLQTRLGLAFKRADAERILRYGFGFSIAKIGNVLALQADNLVVVSFLGNAALGLYSRSYQIIMSPIGLIAMVVDRVLFPAMSRRQNNAATIRNAFLMLNGAVFALFVPLSLVLFEYRHEFVLVLLGSTWSAASAPFGLLGIGLSFRAGYRLSDIVARARGYVYRRAVVQWIYAGCIVLGAGVGARWGLAGVAIGVSAAVAANWVLMTRLTVRSLNIDLAALMASFRPALFTSALVSLAILGLNRLLDRPAPFALPDAAGPALIVAGVLLAGLTALPTRAALRDWVHIFRRARHAS